jgi:hypothetical protein
MKARLFLLGVLLMMTSCSAAAPMADISPASGNEKTETVGFYAFAEDLPNGFELVSATPNLDAAAFATDPETITIVVEADGVFKEEGDTYYYNVAITVLPADYVGRMSEPELSERFEGDENMAMIIAAGEMGYAPGLAEHIRGLMEP